MSTIMYEGTVLDNWLKSESVRKSDALEWQLQRPQIIQSNHVCSKKNLGEYDQGESEIWKKCSLVL